MTAKRLALLALPGILILAPACDPPPDIPADARVVYDTVNGVVHVISGDRGAWVRGGSWNVDPGGVMIGGGDGGEEYRFGEIRGAVIAPDGRIHVADARSGDIRVFDAAGRFIARVGRPGTGPGEFRQIDGLLLAPDGVAVVDGRLGRVTVFRGDGAVARTFRLDRPYPRLEVETLARFDERGRFHDRTHLDPAPGVDDIAVLVHDREGRPTDAIRVATVERRQGPFAPAPSMAIGPDGRVYFTRGDEYRIEVLSPAGDTLRVLRRRVRPRPVTAEERDSLEAALGSDVEIPATKPVIARLFVDETNHLWVGRSVDPGWSHMEWGIHAPDGRYLGALATPVMRVTHIGQAAVAGVVTGADGAERVGVFPIRR